MITRVAMDGPVGAGKSTVAREVSRRLGFIYVDTGALYRAVGVFCKNSGVDTDNPTAVEKSINGRLALDIKLIDGTQHVYVNGDDVSEVIRLPENSMLASKVSAIPAVRAFLLGIQRGMAEKQSVVMDGRDIGTVILPHAEVKIFITAGDEIRAKRRYDELTAKGIKAEFADVLADLRKRDYDDSHRAVAPLKQAEDAVLLDTSALDFEGTVSAVIDIIKSRAEAKQ